MKKTALILGFSRPPGGLGMAMLMGALLTGCSRSNDPPPAATPPESSAPRVETAAPDPIAQARASGRPSWVSFGADKCIPCRTMAPIREALAAQYTGRVNVVYIRVDQHPALAEQHGVQYIPHLIFFGADGKEAITHTGTMTSEEIEAQLQRLVQGP